MRTALLSASLLAITACSLPSPRFDPSGIADARPDVVHWNVDANGLALAGFDPVAYFPEGGSEPRMGDPNRSVRYRGVTYFFASEANRKHFVAAPERFQPAYGGWCAWAMIEAEKVEVEPESFLIQDGELMLFYDGIFGDTRARWMRAPRTSKPLADRSWRQTITPE